VSGARNPRLDWLVRRPIAHRGLHDMNRSVWENTLAAFDRAAAAGYAIECDVHLTRDGEAVVFHDDQLTRLTGTEGFVWQRTAAEMRSLSVGGTADRVPTLAEALARVAGRVPMVIELKGIPGHDAGLVETVAALLADYRGEVAIMSFDHWLLRQLPRAAPGIPRGLTAWGDAPHHIEAHFSMLAHGIDFVSFDVSALDNPFVRFVRDRLNLPVISWTVRDAAAVDLTFRHADQMTFEGFAPAVAMS
jgi:glycerophosphoryl diester phosphodiesterase